MCNNQQFKKIITKKQRLPLSFSSLISGAMIPISSPPLSCKSVLIQGIRLIHVSHHIQSILSSADISQHWSCCQLYFSFLYCL